MATPAMQRYAAEIYRLQQDSHYVALTELSEHAHASAQATSRMVGRMKGSGYLEHELYRGVRLTTKGETIAMPALRRHRLVEVFLVTVLTIQSKIASMKLQNTLRVARMANRFRPRMA